MYRLWEFIRSIYIFVLFFVAEGVAIYTYALSNSYTQAKLIGYTANVVGGVGGVVGSISDYFGLKSKNKMLLDRVVALEAELSSLKTLHSDSLLMAHSYADVDGKYIAARVVSNTINRQHNHLIINRGLLQGVRAGMAVISPKREIVGVVMICEDNYSVVMSVLNLKFRSSGMVKGDGHAGSITWDGLSRYQISMKELSKYAKIVVGSEVVTTGFSQIFPPGVAIGRVVNYRLEERTQSYIVDIDLATDITKLDEVIVVNYNSLGGRSDTLNDMGDAELLKLYHQAEIAN